MNIRERLVDAIENKLVDKDQVLLALINYMPTSEIVDCLEVNEMDHVITNQHNEEFESLCYD